MTYQRLLFLTCLLLSLSFFFPSPQTQSLLTGNNISISPNTVTSIVSEVSGIFAVRTAWAQTSPTRNPIGPSVNTYREKADRYELSLASSPDSGTAEVILMKDRPQVRLKKWNGEVDLGVSYQKVRGQAVRIQGTHRVEWKDGAQEVHAYPLAPAKGMEDGGFEIEVFLKEKPESNVFEFQIDNADRLDFHYQPIVTEREPGFIYNETAFGSYAVYHRTKKDHELGKTNYGTGKVMQIFRPKAFDAEGKEILGDLRYANGVLYVTIPQSFLDSAEYPVIVDPTFGFTSIPFWIGCLMKDQANLFLWSTTFALGANADVQSITAYVNDTSSQVNQYVLYRDSNDSFVAATEIADLGGGEGWQKLNFAIPVSLTAGNYTLAAATAYDGNPTGYYDVIWGDYFQANGHKHSRVTTSYINSYPDPISWSYTGIKLGIYATTGTTVANADITTNTTWTASQSPYRVSDDITVNSGVTLTIEPGVTVYFDGFYGIDAQGVINAQGTWYDPIEFTSYKTSPDPGDWKYIKIRNEASVLDYVRVFYSDQGVYVPSGATNPATIQNSVFKFNNNGIYFESGTSPTIEYNTITQNVNGIYAECNASSGCSPQIAYNSILSNSNYNLLLDSAGTNASAVTVNARNNWWGVQVFDMISAKIHDFFDDNQLPIADIVPVLDDAVPHGGQMYPTPPAPVLNTAIGLDHSAQLAWSPVQYATGYKIRYGTSSGNYGSPVNVGNVTGYTVPNLTPATLYYFVVFAYNDGSQGPNSNELSATPTAIVGAKVLTPIPGSTISAANNTFTWDSVEGATAYTFLAGTSPGAGDIANSGTITATSHNVNNIPINGSPFYVRLSSLINGTWTSNDYSYSTGTNPVVHFSGSGSGVKYFENSSFWQRNTYNLSVDFTVHTANPVDNGSTITYDLILKTGTVDVHMVAEDFFNDEYTQATFDHPQQIATDAVQGTLTVSKTDFNNQVIQFTTPPSGFLPYVVYVHYSGLTGKATLTYQMPFPWDVNVVNVLDIDATDNYNLPCTFVIDQEKTTLLPGDITHIFAQTPVKPGDSLQWTVTPVAGETARAVITTEGNTKQMATISDVRGNGLLNVHINNPSLPACQKDILLEIGCGCQEGGVCAFDDKEELSSIEVNFNLGRISRGKSLGVLRLKADAPDPANATPNILQLFTFDSSVEMLYNGAVLRQVLGPEVLVDITPLDQYRYTIAYYKVADITGKVGGFYQVVGGAVPLKFWTIENPDASPTVFSRLRVSESEPGNSKSYLYAWDQALQTWSLDSGDGLQVKTLKNVTGGGLRVATETVKDANGIVASKIETTYKFIPGPDGMTEEIIKTIEDPTGDALTTITTYYENSGELGFGNIKSIEYPNGSWINYEYDSLGRKSAEITPWLDSPIGSPAASARAVSFDYTSQHASDSFLAEDARKPRKVTEKIQDQTVGLTFYVYNKTSGVRTTTEKKAVSPNALYADADNLTTVTVTNAYTFGSVNAWRVNNVTHPDGQKDTYSYEYGNYAPDANPSLPGIFTPGIGTDERESVIHGTAASPLGIANKTMAARTVRNNKGETLLDTEFIYNGTQALPFGSTVWRYDSLGHVIEVNHINGTKEESLWGCCTKQSDIDISGILHNYTYDAINRLLTSTKEAGANDVVTEYTYDAAGRKLSEEISSSGLMLSSFQDYDISGRLETSTDQAGLVTGYTYSPDGRTTTVTRPGGAQEITAQYLDGQSKSVTGNAVVAQFYSAGVNPDGSLWTQVNTGSVASPAFEKTTVDMAGRTIKVEKPGFGPIETTQYFYNTIGQLIKTITTGQADVLYEYDPLSHPVRSGLDMDANGVLGLSTLDRISESDTSFTNLSTFWWEQSVQKVYPTDNNATPTTTDTQRTQLNGFTAGVVDETVSTDMNGNITTAKTTINRVAKTQTRQVTYPDSNVNEVSVTTNGLLTSTTSKAGLTTSYSYDTLERQTGVTDPRTGLSEIHYLPSTGQVDFIEDAADNRTTYSYQALTGRKESETNALNQVTRFAYNDRGELTETWGDVPYPVRYVYDNYGRMTEMDTWRNDSLLWNDTTFPAGADGNEDVTTWEYQEATGLLTRKTDDAGEHVDYTYTTGGKPATRIWARLPAVATTYGYDPKTAELLTVDYSDTTPDLTFTYDRLGRQKTVADALGDRTFAYNAALNLLTETITGLYNKTLTRTYAATGVIGRPTGFNTGSSYSVTYGYDATGRMNSVASTVNAVTKTATYAYLANSDLIETLSTGAGGQLTTYAYEANRNLKAQVNNKFNNVLKSQYDYLYDAVGRRTSVKNSGPAFAAAALNKFQYNSRSELSESKRHLGTDVNNPGAEVTAERRLFTYDPIGNRKTLTQGTSNGTYTTNNLNQYTNTTLPTSNNFTSDKDGNLTQITGAKNVTYTYDAENRLVTAAPTTPVTNNKKLDFLYDYQGRRIQKIISNWNGSAWVVQTTKRYVYDGWNMIEEQTVSPAATQFYVWGLDLSQSLQGAGGIGGLLASVNGTTIRNFLYDGNGNVGQLMNAANGALEAQYEYDPYGNQIVATGAQAAANPYRFSTKYLDTDFNLYYYGYRYYDPEMGRWLNRDPIGERGSVNLYLFVENSSINSYDVLGLLTPRNDADIVFARNWAEKNIKEQATRLPLATKLLSLWLSGQQKETYKLSSDIVDKILSTSQGKSAIDSLESKLFRNFDTAKPLKEGSNMVTLNFEKAPKDGGQGVVRTFGPNSKGGLETDLFLSFHNIYFDAKYTGVLCKDDKGKRSFRGDAKYRIWDNYVFSDRKAVAVPNGPSDAQMWQVQQYGGAKGFRVEGNKDFLNTVIYEKSFIESLSDGQLYGGVYGSFF